MLRIPHCLESQIAGGGEGVSLTCSAPQKHYFLLVVNMINSQLSGIFMQLAKLLRFSGRNACVLIHHWHHSHLPSCSYHARTEANYVLTLKWVSARMEVTPFLILARMFHHMSVRALCIVTFTVVDKVHILSNVHGCSFIFALCSVLLL
jgi:hypothetical protein